jgi:transcriptional regulator with XRE-family HTH domain
MDLRHRFATNLRRIRHDRGISQEDLAYEAGVDRAYVSRIERAITYVGLEIIGKFAEVLRVDPAEFSKFHPDVTEEVESKAPGEAANSRAALLTPKGAALSLASAGATALFALVPARDVRPVRNAGPQSGRSGDKFRRQPRGEGTR